MAWSVRVMAPKCRSLRVSVAQSECSPGPKGSRDTPSAAKSIRAPVYGSRAPKVLARESELGLLLMSVVRAGVGAARVRSVADVADVADADAAIGPQQCARSDGWAGT